MTRRFTPLLLASLLVLPGCTVELTPTGAQALKNLSNAAAEANAAPREDGEPGTIAQTPSAYAQASGSAAVGVERSGSGSGSAGGSVGLASVEAASGGAGAVSMASVAGVPALAPAAGSFSVACGTVAVGAGFTQAQEVTLASAGAAGFSTAGAAGSVSTQAVPAQAVVLRQGMVLAKGPVVKVHGEAGVPVQGQAVTVVMGEAGQLVYGEPATVVFGEAGVHVGGEPATVVTPVEGGQGFTATTQAKWGELQPCAGGGQAVMTPVAGVAPVAPVPVTRPARRR